MEPPTQVDQIPSGALNAFIEEMLSRSFDKDKYDLTYFADSECYFVVTRYKEKPSRLRGSVEGFPDYEVRISRKDFKVMNVSIQR